MISRKLPSYLAAGTLALGMAAVAPPAIGAQPQPGRLFRLSSCFTCSQHEPSVAANAAGDILGAWVEPRDVVSEGVFSRAFNPALAADGNDFEVAPGAPGDPPQFDGVTAADSKGNFVVVWATESDDQSAIVAQRFDPKGNPLGGQIEVAADPASTPATPSDFKPAVAAAPGGGFVVAWVSLPTGGETPGPPRVMVRTFDAAGAAAGPAVQLSTGLAIGDRPSLCVSSTGRIHAAWTFANVLLPFQPGLVGVVLRRLEANGAPLGGEQVVAAAVDHESSAAVACGPGNTYVVAWQTAQPPAVSGSDIVAQRYSRIGRAIGPRQVLNQQVAQDQQNPALLFDPTGALVAVWESDPGGVHEVRGRRFAGNGAPLSNEFPVLNAGQGEFAALRPAISGIGKGSNFVVVMDAPEGILGRVFTVPGSTGAAAAGEVADAGAEDAIDGGGTTGNGRGAGGLW